MPLVQTNVVVHLRMMSLHAPSEKVIVYASRCVFAKCALVWGVGMQRVSWDVCINRHIALLAFPARATLICQGKELEILALEVFCLLVKQ